MPPAGIYEKDFFLGKSYFLYVKSIINGRVNCFHRNEWNEHLKMFPMHNAQLPQTGFTFTPNWLTGSQQFKGIVNVANRSKNATSMFVSDG